LADETVVVGAHYDHLGYGGAGSLAPWTREIHNGADDNASGSAVLVEVARAISGGDLPASRRRIVFVAFAAEERGLLGSQQYVRSPAVPLEKTVAMVNLDMVGRLTDNRLIVYGTGTAEEFDPLVDRLNQHYGFEIKKEPGGYGPSDHATFYAKQIPVLHFFTGNHNDYHRPSDDADKLNLEGMRRIQEMVTEIVRTVASAETRPKYLATQTPRSRGGGDRPYFGSVPEFGKAVEGYALMSVTPNGPAERAGLKAGDVIVQLGASRIGGLEDFDSALRKFSAGDQVAVRVKRGDQELELTVTLDPPK
jgi:Zn-dependent M28 family amino/carboxypeptidase